jgi:aspartate kinase
MSDSVRGLRVVKLGGSVLRTPVELARAAHRLRELSAHPLLVVASAPHGLTDWLLRLTGSGPSAWEGADRAALLELGERAGARWVAAALRAEGLAVERLEPDDPAWPVITRGGPLDAELDDEATALRAREHLPARLARAVVVLPGFVGRDRDLLTTLRRGGSDTTALALGNFLAAEEVILVKDVPGILTADPKLASDARVLPEVSVDELQAMVDHGARVVAREALRYLNGRTRLRVTSLDGPLAGPGGTLVRRDRVGNEGVRDAGAVARGPEPAGGGVAGAAA